MASADFCAFGTALQPWLRLSAHSAQTSPGTTRFFPSIYLLYLPHAIPCSDWASTCLAALPSHIAFYAISVRQARGLPVVFPHNRLPSDSTSRWTPLPSAISFPLPGGFDSFTLWKRAPPGAPPKTGRSMRKHGTPGLDMRLSWSGGAPVQRLTASDSRTWGKRRSR